MIVYGGYTGTKTFNDMYSFDFVESRWTEIKYQSPAPPASYLCSVAGHKDSLYVYGGDSDRMASVWKFSFENNTWGELKGQGRIPEKRFGHSAVVYEDSMYIFGGQTKSGVYLNELWEYSLATNQWSININIAPNSPPPARYTHATTMMDKCMYVYGGTANNPFLNDLYCFNFETKQWSTMVSTSFFHAPSGRRFGSITGHDSKLYLFGGIAQKGYKNNLYKYSLKKQKWIKVTPIKPSKLRMTGVPQSGPLYLQEPPQCSHKKFGCGFIGNETEVDQHLINDCPYEKIKNVLNDFQQKSG